MIHSVAGDSVSIVSGSRRHTPASQAPSESMNVKDTRAAAYIQDKHVVPDYVDYSAWQRTSVKSEESPEGKLERPTSPETEIVRLQIKARRKTLQQYQKMNAKLLACNLELMQEIQHSESDVHEEVSVLLDQYDKFRGAIGNIRHQSEESVRVAEERLRKCKVMSSAEIESLRLQVESIDKKLEEKTTEFEVLLKFKGTDKEYHMRAVKVAELRQELDNLHTEQYTEKAELKDLVQRHHANLNSSIDKRWKEIQASLTASAVKNIPESLREIARQNRVMQREIALHKDEIHDTDSEIMHTKDQIKDLQDQKKFRTQLHGPQLKDVCSPESELALDIPTFRMLPV